MENYVDVWKCERSYQHFVTLLIQLCTLYYSELKMTEELSKHVFKELNVLYKRTKLIFKSSAVLYLDKTNNVSIEFIINLSQFFFFLSQPFFIVVSKLWETNTRSMVLDFQGEQNMTIRRAIIQRNESRLIYRFSQA